MSQPNFIFILTDQQRLSTLSTYGQTPCMTPNLDKLAGRSIVFDNAYTPCPLCTPARASMMTGLYPHQHGMTSNTGNTSCAVHNLRDRPELLSRRLQSAGYDCLYTGKWHLGWRETQLFCEQIPPALPRDVGFIGHNCPGHGGPGFNFQDYKDYLQRLGMTNNIREKLRLGKGFVPSYGIQELPEEGTVPYFLAEHTIQRIDEFADSGKPFFLWHNFWGPHEGYFVPEAFYDMYRNVSIPEWPNYRWPSDQIEGPHRIAINPSHSQLKWEDWEEVIRYYYAFMTLIDKQIGRIVDHLESRGLMDNTILCFASDHGETLGSHGGLMDKGIFHFEEIQRVPLFLRLPGDEHGGERNNQLVSLVDMYPTILSAAAADYPADQLPGRSIFDLIEGCDDWREDLVIQSEGVESVNITLRTLRHDKYKYGFTVGMKEQLYDLHDDPHEMTNLVDDPQYADVLDNMRTRLVNWMQQQGDRCVRNGVKTYLLRMGWREADA